MGGGGHGWQPAAVAWQPTAFGWRGKGGGCGSNDGGHRLIEGSQGPPGTRPLCGAAPSCGPPSPSLSPRRRGCPQQRPQKQQTPLLRMRGVACARSRQQQYPLPPTPTLVHTVPQPNLPKPQGATLLDRWLRTFLCLFKQKIARKLRKIVGKLRKIAGNCQPQSLGRHGVREVQMRHGPCQWSSHAMLRQAVALENPPLYRSPGDHDERTATACAQMNTKTAKHGNTRLENCQHPRDSTRFATPAPTGGYLPNGVGGV